MPNMCACVRVCAARGQEAGGDSMSASAGAEGGALVAEGIKDLRFVFKVVPSLSLILALAHDGRQALHLSDGSLFALYVPPAAPRALEVGAHDTDADAASEPSQASPVLTKLMLRGASLDRVQGRRCALHAVNHHIVLLPLVRFVLTPARDLPSPAPSLPLCAVAPLLSLPRFALAPAPAPAPLSRCLWERAELPLAPGRLRLLLYHLCLCARRAERCRRLARLAKHARASTLPLGSTPPCRRG